MRLPITITMKSRKLNEILEKIGNEVSGVIASAVVTSEGVVRVGEISKNVDMGIVASTATALLSVSRKISMQLLGKKPQAGVVKGEDGYILVAPMGEDTFLAVMNKNVDPFRLLKELLDIISEYG